MLIDSDQYKKFLILKEYLIQNNTEAMNDSNFKQEMITLLPQDCKEYKKVKSGYVSALLKRIKEWYAEGK